MENVVVGGSTVTDPACCFVLSTVACNPANLGQSAAGMHGDAEPGRSREDRA